MARIYVSSTYNDLKECREQVRLTLRRMGHEDVAMEYYVAEDQRPLDKCLKDVETCDLYIGIFALRYGYVPPGYDKSITELEFRRAQERGIDCLIFLAEEESWPFGKVEVEAFGKIKSLRDELSKEYLGGFFIGKDDIGARVAEAIHNWERQQGLKVEGERTDWDAYRQAVFEEHQWVRLAVIAGAKQDRIARIPLIEVFVPQMTETGLPTYEIPEEVLEFKRTLFTKDRAVEVFDEGISPETDTEGLSEDLGELVGAFPEPVLDVLARERTQVILGGPGSGKSTLLHYAMLILCDLERSKETLPSHLQNSPIPFPIELRQYVIKNTSNFVEYIVANSRERYGVPVEAESLRSLLDEDRRALIFFDGLDEVFDPTERSRVIQQFRTFARQYPRAQIAVTSRIVGYDKTELGVAGFRHYTLLDFNAQQIRQFVPKWYQYYTWEGDERDALGLTQRIIESPRLMDLAGNPLLLTMMAVIYKHQDLPEQRWKLYERCTEVLLEDWDIKRKSIDLEELLPLDVNIRAPQKAEILQLVSMYMLERGQEGRELNAIAYQPLVTILAKYLREKYSKSPGDAEAIAEGILNHLRERTYILAEIGEGIFGFVHRTFMEYFAACHCKAEFNARKADYKWLSEETFGAHWRRDDWQEVLLLLIAMLSDQGSPILEVVDYLRSKCEEEIPFNVAFAARCLAEAGTVEDQRWAQGLITELVQAIADHTAQSKKDKATAFIDAGLTAFSMLAPMVSVPPKAKKTISRLDKSKTLRERMVAWQMGFALRSRQERLDFALSALGDEEEAVRRGAIAALEREWPGKEQVGQALVDLIRTDRYARVRQAAMEALQRAWPEDIEILDAIETRIEEESAYTYVIWVIEYLAANWRGHPKALSLVLRLAGPKPKASLEYDYESVSQSAVRSIVQGWRDHPDTLPLLHDRAVNDTDSSVRATAHQAIAQGWRDHSDTLPLLHDRAVNDTDSSVRKTALSIIAGLSPSYYYDLPHRFLYELPFYKDEFISPRMELGEGWRDHPDTLPLLRDRAVNDTDSSVRVFAIQAIAQSWRDHPDTLPLLRDRAVNDTDSSVRRTALSIIAGPWPSYYYDLPRRLLYELPFYEDEFISPRMELGEGWRDHPDTLPLLRDRAVNDTDSSVRVLAIQAIVQFWRDHPDIVPLLRDRIANEPDIHVWAQIQWLLNNIGTRDSKETT